MDLIIVDLHVFVEKNLNEQLSYLLRVVEVDFLVIVEIFCIMTNPLYQGSTVPSKRIILLHKHWSFQAYHLNSTMPMYIMQRPTLTWTC